MKDLYQKDDSIIKSIQLLYEQEYIDDPRCQGIARQIMARGTRGLSKKQKYLYQTQIEPLIKTEIKSCHWCYEEILKGDSAQIQIDFDNIYWCSYTSCKQNSMDRGF